MNRASRAVLVERSARTLFAVGAVALVARVAVACANTDTAGLPLDGPDSSSTVTPPVPELDATTPDDGSVEAHAPPSQCTEEGWCYSELPTEDSYDASAMPPIIVGPSFGLRGVWVAPDNRAWAVSTGGHVLLWNGMSWHVVALMAADLRTVWGSSADEVWIGGERGAIFRGKITGNDVAFEKINIGTTQTIGRITGTSRDDIWAIADGQSGSNNLNRVWRFTPADGGTGGSFVQMTVPSSFTHSSARLRVQALWFDATSLWIGGYETTSCGPVDCTFQNQLVAAKWNGPTDAGPAWEHIPLLQGYSDPVADAIASSDGVQLLAVRGPHVQARVVRVADDATKLDPGAFDPEADGGITHVGSYAWTRELAHEFGTPNAIWARSANDVWLVGESGIIRHFDGSAWKLVPLSLTRTTPLLQDLHAIHAGPVVAGEREIWVVGNDVALHRKVKE
jgi:hypothetical protein